MGLDPGSAPPATTDPGQPEWPATSLHSDVARQWPKSCAVDPGAGSCPWVCTPRSVAPGSSIARPRALLLLIQERQNARHHNRFKLEQALVNGLDDICAPLLGSELDHCAGP